MRNRSVGLARRGVLVACVLGFVPTVAQVWAAPVTTPPGEGDTGESTTSEPSGPSTGIELIPDLGDGGQPDELTREIVIAGERFLFDRIVPLARQELVSIAQEREIIAHARTAQGPFTAVYLSAPPRAEDEMARYLPEQVGAPDVTCPAETADVAPVDADGVRYAFAGNETDLTADVLQHVGDSDEGPIYADLTSTPPHAELFFESGGELLRFLLIGPDGRPAPISESLAFNGTRFGFDSDVTDSVDPAGLTKVGCSTAFPVYAPTGSPADASTELYVLAAGRYLRFAGDGAPAATTTPEPTPTTTTTLPPTTTSTTTTLPPTTTTLPPTTTSTTTTTPPPTTTSTTTTTPPPTTTSTTTTLPPTTTTLPPTTTTLPPTTSTLPPSTTSTTTSVAPIETSTTTTTLSPTTSTTSTEPPGTTTTTAPELEPPAVVLTLPPDAPPPAASTATQHSCPGDPGELSAQGVPVNLPTRIQVGGVAYLFAGAEAPADVGTLNRIGCAGPFELTVTDGADQADVIYLRPGPTGPVYRFDAALTFEVQFQASEQPQTITALDERYRLERAWQPSVYSSASVILFVEDPAAPAPPVVYGVNVTQTAVGDAIGEYRSVAEPTQPSAELAAAAEQEGLHPDLMINGQTYVLADIFTPAGTTRNGFMTLFASTTDQDAQVLLGRDTRDVELFVFVLEVAGDAQG